MENKKSTSPVLRIPVWIGLEFGFHKTFNFLATRVAKFVFCLSVLKGQFVNKRCTEHIKGQLPYSKIGKEIQVFRFAGEGPKVLLLHGWSGRGSQLFAFADKLRKSNAEVVTFDMPAHGQSLGNKTNIVELVACIKKSMQNMALLTMQLHTLWVVWHYCALSDGITINQLQLLVVEIKLEMCFIVFLNNTGSDKVAERMIQTVEKQFGINLEIIHLVQV